MKIAKVTKNNMRDFVKAKLQSNPKWAVNALLRVYSFQTSGEKQMYTSAVQNNKGFTAFDAELLTSFKEKMEEAYWDHTDPVYGKKIKCAKKIRNYC